MRKTLCVAVLFVVVGCGDDDADPPAPGADTVADVTYDGKIMGDEEVGQAEFLLQIHEEIHDLCLD